MAKNKPVLTPEELEAKNARKEEKRKIFGETFFKSLAVLMSIVLVYSIVYIAFGQGTTIEQKVVTQGSSNAGNGGAAQASQTQAAAVQQAELLQAETHQATLPLPTLQRLRR